MVFVLRRLKMSKGVFPLGTEIGISLVGLCASSGFTSSVFPLYFRLLAPAENAAVAPQTPRSDLEIVR